MHHEHEFLSHQRRKELKKHLLIIFSLILISVVAYEFVSPSKPISLTVNEFLTRIVPGKSDEACDYSDGKWVWDETLPGRRYSEECPFLDPGFRCRRNGRQDLGFQKWRWQPHGCDLPSHFCRFEVKDFLERNRNGRVVFAGDSIGRNQWESLICMLTLGISNQSTIYEENGNPITKHKGFLSMKFQEYNLTVQYFRVPYLVIIDRPPRNAPKEVRGTIRVDKLHWYSSKWVGADVLVFSAGHWWNRDKTVKSGLYFQEGDYVNMTMDVTEAFRKSLITVKLWAMQNLEPGRSHLFFRAYAPTHYRDGEWNKGGYCNTSLEPETNYSKLEPEPLNNILISEAVEQMRSTLGTVKFVNITYMTELRKDGHPSTNREPGTPANAPQDCSHWCLPGVPDTWNEVLYTEMLSMGFRTRPT